MWSLIFGGLLVFTGFYLIFKVIYENKKGEHIPAQLTGYKNENNSYFPVFRFNYQGQEFNITGSTAVSNPEKYKYQVGDTVNVIFVPSNTKYVGVEGSKIEYLYALGAIAGGAVFILMYFR